MPKLPNTQLREDLIESALMLLEETGLPSFSMRELAGRVDYSVTAVYRCFESRADLMKALQMELFSQLGHTLIKEMNPGQSTRALIRTLGRDFLVWAVEHPAQYHFMFHTTEPDVLLDEPEQALARMPLEHLKILLEAGNARGDLAVDAPASLATMLFATLHGLVSLHLSRRLDRQQVPDPVEFYDQWASVWLDSLLAEHQTVRP
jgi:AcrR family transcriptional regulator